MSTRMCLLREFDKNFAWWDKNIRNAWVPIDESQLELESSRMRHVQDGACTVKVDVVTDFGMLRT